MYYLSKNEIFEIFLLIVIFNCTRNKKIIKPLNSYLKQQTERNYFKKNKKIQKKSKNSKNTLNKTQLTLNDTKFDKNAFEISKSKNNFCGNKFKGLQRLENIRTDSSKTEIVPPYFGINSEISIKILNFGLKIKGKYTTIKSCLDKITEIYKNSTSLNKIRSKEIVQISNTIEILISSKECLDFIKAIKDINDVPLEKSIIPHLKNIADKGYYTLAIRSSSTTEDGENNPAAGLYDTIIGVPIYKNHNSNTYNIDIIFENILKVIKSIWKPKVFSKHFSQKINLKNNRMGIVIQGLFNSQISGIVYSQSNTHFNMACLTYGPGQCDQLVSGKIKGGTLFIPRFDIFRYLNNDISFSELVEKLIEQSGSNPKHYLYITNQGKKKNIKNQNSYNISIENMYRLLKPIYDTKEKNENLFKRILKEELVKIIINCVKDSNTLDKERDQEFAIKLDHLYTIKSILVQDRALPKPQNIIYLQQKDYNYLCSENLINEPYQALSNGQGAGILINEDDFFALTHKKQTKYIIIANNDASPFDGYLPHISGIISKNDCEANHMSNECDNKGIALLSSKQDFSSYIGELLTIANIQVNNNLKSLLLKKNQMTKITNFKQKINISTLKTKFENIKIENFKPEGLELSNYYEQLNYDMKDFPNLLPQKTS